MISPEELAYCAGIVDADGTIGIKRSTYQIRVTKEASQPVFSERICVKQVEPHAVNLLHELFGGTRYHAAAHTPKSKRLYVWQVTDLKAVNALRQMLPYLRIKRRQAEVCLILRGLKEQSKKAKVAFGRGCAGCIPRPAHLTEAMEQCRTDIQVMNKVGI